MSKFFRIFSKKISKKYSKKISKNSFFEKIVLNRSQIRGSIIKYLRIPDDVIKDVRDEVVAARRAAANKKHGDGMRGRGRGRGRGGYHR